MKFTDEEREAQWLAQEQQRAQLRGRRQGRKWLKALLLTIPFLLITVGFAVAGMIIYSHAGQNIDTTGTRSGKAVLQQAVAAAQSAANDHNGSFASLTTDALKHADPEIKWVNGSPGSGQVGVIETGTVTFKFVYKDDSGAEYIVSRDEQGVISYLDSNGNPL